MAETENKYVKPITLEKKQAIVDTSVQSMNKRPTSDETAMKKRFVQPIVNLDGTPCLADEVDRVANEADQAFHNVATSITELQGMDAAISETASTALEKANKAEEDIFQLQVGFGAVSAVGGALQDLESKVAYAKASKIEVSVDPLTFVATFKLLGDYGITISTAEIDLPLESMVVDAKYYPEDGGAIVLTLQSGRIIVIPVADIVRGLISVDEKGAANGVASLDANGKVPKEQLPDDIGSGGGTSADLSDYVKKTQLATSSTAGLVKVSTSYGMEISNGFIMVQPATESQVTAKSSKYAALTPSVVDDIVKVGATTNTITLTDEEKASACDWLGAVPKWKPAADGSTTLVGLRADGAYYVYNLTFGIPRNNAIPCYVARGAGNNVLGTGTPVNDTDCANKTYVDNLPDNLTLTAEQKAKWKTWLQNILN